MITSSTGLLGYFLHITQVLNVYAPFSYAFIVFLIFSFTISIIVIIKTLRNLHDLQKKFLELKQFLKYPNKENIIISNIQPYCNEKDGVQKIGIELSIVNTSMQPIYCKIDNEVTKLHINNEKSPRKYKKQVLTIYPYGSQNVFNAIETDIDISNLCNKKSFLIEFHIVFDFYDKEGSVNFSKKCHYQAECSFVENARDSNIIHLKVHYVKCKDIPETEFTSSTKP